MNNNLCSHTYVTKNYDQFKPLFCNRGKLRIDKDHLNRLEESILNRNLLKHRPILVNKDYEIIDGHHRYEIAKKHGLDLYFNVQDDASYNDAITLTRGVTNWTFKNYIECRAMNNEEDYVKLNKFMEDNNISVHNLFRLFSTKSHSDYWIAKIKKGTFKFDDSLYQLVPIIDKIHEIFNALKQFGYKKSRFDKSFFLVWLLHVLQFSPDKLDRVQRQACPACRKTCKTNIMERGYRSLMLDL